MAVKLVEGKRDLNIDAKSAGITRNFVVYRSTDETEIYEALRDGTDEIWDELIRTKINAKEVSPAAGIWEATVEYGDPGGGDSTGGAGGTPVGATPVTPDSGPSPTQPLTPGDPAMGGLEVSFDFSGQTKHITQSLQTRASYKRGGGTPPDHKGAIGVTKDGVAGCDIYAGHSEMTITQKLPAVNLQMIRLWRSLVATWNDATWWGYAQGECLYLGGTGQGTQRGQWTIAHKVAIGENREDVVICEDLTIDSIDAWDHVWFGYQPNPAAGDNKGLPIVDSAYVEQVYYPGDFSGLGIGV